MRRTLWTAVPAVALVPLLCGTAPVAMAAASSGDVTVTDTESVQVHLDATGRLQDARVFDQLAFSGKGTASVSNPVGTSGLRNLDGFRGWTVKDGAQVTTVDVDGERRLRSMSNYDKDLPLSVTVTYRLDGKEVEPGDVVGRSGTLEVHYVVENLTAKTQTVTYDDGKGGTGSTDATTVVPMIGELVTVLPPSFTAVSSDEAAIGGDGRGGTQLQFQMTLFPPIGSAKAEFGYTAHVSKGVVPKATMTALPVSPLDFPSYKDGSATIKAGGEQGVALTSGALQVDANLLKLHDGAAQLLAGLLQLKSGADQLHSGLSADAVPGADALASGLGGQLSPGATQLAAGLNGQLAPGAKELADGLAAGRKDFPQLSGGAKTLFEVLDGQLSAGSASLAAGLNGQLAPGAQDLADGLADGAGEVPQLVAGLAQLSTGLSNLDGGLASLSATLGSAATKSAATSQLHAGIASLLTSIGSHQALTVPGTSSPTLFGGIAQLGQAAGGAFTQVTGSLDQIHQGIGAVQGYLGDVTPADAASAQNLALAAGTLSAIDAKVQDRSSLTAQATALTGAVAALECAIDRSAPAGCTGTSPTLAEGLGAVDTGIDTMVDAVVQNVQAAIGSPTTSATTTLRGGVAALSGGAGRLGSGADDLASGLAAAAAGSQSLADGLAQAGDGSAQLADGVSAVASGSKDLADGVSEAQSKVDEAAAGSKKLSDGVADAAAGSSRLADGAKDAAAGSSRLASGLHDAADGSGRIADGLGQATDEATGAPALVDGAQQLSDQGTSQIVASGAETAASFGAQYAVLQANAQRASTEGMAYGAPEGASGATAYSIEIAGADGSGGRALGLGLAGVALFGIGAGVASLVRRRWV